MHVYLLGAQLHPECIKNGFKLVVMPALHRAGVPRTARGPRFDLKHPWWFGDLSTRQSLFKIQQ